MTEHLEKKRFEQMTYEELIVAKAAVDSKLRAAKLEVGTMKATAHAKGEWATPEAFHAAHDRVNRLAFASQRAQMELAKRNRERRAAAGATPVERRFVDLARERLDPTVFNGLLDAAKTPSPTTTET